MNERLTFGIVGGYGATGRAATSELWKSGAGDIVIGGRDLDKGKALAAQFDHRVSAAQVDVLDAGSLDSFCKACSIIVNCGGPVMTLQDRVAQSAFRTRCHYVDVAGLSFVREGMLAHGQEIADRGLSFVVSAGWQPGITEFLPVYAHAQARARMETIESLSVYFGDSGDWSAAAFQDIAWYLRRNGLGNPCFFRKGERVRVNMLQASVKVDLRGRVGRRRFSLFSMSEPDEVGRRLNDCDVFIYAQLPGIFATMAATLVALVPLPRSSGAPLLRHTFRRSSLPVGGFVVVRVLGQSQGRQQVLSAEIFYDKQRDYWINGLVVATVARMISEGRGVQSGLHFLADAVDPLTFMAEVQRAGIGLTECFVAGGSDDGN
jgi:hypothetical protein